MELRKFIEHAWQRELLSYQQQVLQMYETLPDGAKIEMYPFRKGTRMIATQNGQLLEFNGTGWKIV